MPVSHDARKVHASPEELNRWLGRESAGEPVQIASESADLSADLSLTFAQGRSHEKPAATGLERAEQVANPKGVSKGIDTAEAKQAQHKTKKSKKSKKNSKSKGKAGSK